MAVPSAQGAVLVIGSGVARDCYEAVKYERVAATRALDICDLAIEQERMTAKNRAATYVNRGILHMRQGNNERAIVDFDNSLRLQPELYEAQVNRGAALYGLRRFNEALEALNIGVRSSDLDARVTGYYNRGLTHEQLGDITSAYYDYREATRLDPEFALAARQLTRFTVQPVR
jgi:tetratricopeptide (TPR) repeat protein